MIAGDRAPKTPFGNTLESRLAHQTGHPMPPASKPSFTQFGSDPKTAIGAGTLRMDGEDFAQQSAIFLASRILRPTLPRIIATSRNSQDAAHEPNGIGGPVTRYALKPGIDSLAKYAAASRKNPVLA